jgi:hypothetical protein
MMWSSGGYTSWEVNSRLGEALYIGLQTTFDGSRPQLMLRRQVVGGTVVVKKG